MDHEGWTIKQLCFVDAAWRLFHVTSSGDIQSREIPCFALMENKEQDQQVVPMLYSHKSSELKPKFPSEVNGGVCSPWEDPKKVAFELGLVDNYEKDEEEPTTLEDDSPVSRGKKRTQRKSKKKGKKKVA